MITKARRRSFAAQIVILSGAVAFMLVIVPLALSHEAPKGWKYPWACCSTMDCREVSSGASGFVSDPSDKNPNYVINSTGEQIAPGDKRIKESPDGEYHWCAHQAGIDAGQTICLFVPPKGF